MFCKKMDSGNFRLMISREKKIYNCFDLVDMSLKIDSYKNLNGCQFIAPNILLILHILPQYLRLPVILFYMYVQILYFFHNILLYKQYF